MKLSDFENEEALDLLADIIEPASEIMTDQKVVGILKSGKPTIFAVAEILKSHKKSTIEIIAAIHRVPPEKVRFNVVSVTKDILDILNDPQVQQVFTLQSQTTPNTSSGSAMGNTEEDEK